MKYILAAIFLIGTTLAFPLGDESESKQPDASIINPNSLSSAKSQESDEVPKPHHHHDDESPKDVSHEHHKDIQHDSSEASESSESNEKPKLPEALPEIQPEKEKLPEPEEQQKPKEEPKLQDEKPLLEERLIDIVEAANKPAAIAAESSALPEEQFAKSAEPEKQDNLAAAQPEPIPQAAIEQAKSVAGEENAPKDNELASEGKSDILDLPQDAAPPKEPKPEKIAEELPKEVQKPIEGSIEKGKDKPDDSPSS